MKKLFAILMSLHLILMPAAMGQSQPGVEVGTNNSYDNQSQIKKGGYDFYAKTILAIGTSIVGANIISQCSFGLKVPSIATFMAGWGPKRKTRNIISKCRT
jgi:hypothetical protein